MEKNLKNLTFPVYPVGSAKGTITKEGFNVIYTSIFGVSKVLDIDDPDKIFALRRMAIPLEIRKSLTVAVLTYTDIAKYKDGLFIDSTGFIFKYKKEHFHKISFHKIDHYTKVNMGYLVKVEGFHFYFNSVNPPLASENYAGLINLSNKKKMLYGFFTEKYDNTKRKL